jgi:FMN phosphatase YigB (HAD superfamily)
MIKAVFFDYDGVLTTDKSGLLTTFGYLSAATGIGLSAISAAFEPHVADLLTGKTNHALIWRNACEAMGREYDPGVLAHAFESTPINSAMFLLAKALGSSHTVGIITDNSKDRMEHVRRHQNLDALFNPIVVSADVGTGKRGEEIFLHAVSLAGVAPSESVFIDNSEANVEMARACGMQAIFHDDDKNDMSSLKAALESLGVCVANR